MATTAVAAASTSADAGFDTGVDAGNSRASEGASSSTQRVDGHRIREGGGMGKSFRESRQKLIRRDPRPKTPHQLAEQKQRRQQFKWYMLLVVQVLGAVALAGVGYLLLLLFWYPRSQIFKAIRRAVGSRTADE